MPEVKKIIDNSCEKKYAKLSYIPLLNAENYLENNKLAMDWIFSDFFHLPCQPISKEIHGRFELLHNKPDIYYDSAHNEISFDALCKMISSQDDRPWMIYLNIMKERNFEMMLQRFQNLQKKMKADVYFFETSDKLFYQKDEILKSNFPIQILSESIKKHIFKNPQASHLVTGSLYFYRDIIQLLNKE